jgi:hypothetical protein
MKYLFMLILAMFFWSQAQTPAQKIDHAFDLLDQASYWKSRSITDADGSATFIDVDYIAPDSYRTIIQGSGPEDVLVKGIHIGDTGWVSVNGDPWKEGYAESTIIDFGEDSFVGAKIEFLGRKPVPFKPAVACDNYKIEGFLEVCIEVVSGLPAQIQASDGTGSTEILYTFDEPAPITPPITVEIE